MPTIESLLEDARKRLVETGTRNRLIHVNRKPTRGNLLNVINERSDDIFKILRLSGRKMRFSGKGEEEESDSDGVIFAEIEDQAFDEGRYTDSVLETPLTPDALQKRLLKLSKDARTAEEEQGINILYLAMGFLQWYEDTNSKILRESPLILLPVELVRNNKTSTYDLLCRDDDIVANLSLQERLKQDFDISLPEIDDSIDWNPSEYFRQVSETIEGKDRWNVDPDGMQLGFFSFAKLMMLRDLDPANWDEQSLTLNKLISGLLADGFQPETPLFRDDDNIDDKLDPDQILHVVDADSSQTKVIEEVRAGRNLVVQGPPGTGKSQTITNILAAAAYDNKKVLFVAEKMAALEVVYNRMCKVGLKDMCLELHSRRANKKIFLQGLAETISTSKGIETPSLDATELREARDELNQVANLLHEPLSKRDYTPFSTLSKLVPFVSKNIRAPRFDASALESLGKDQEIKLFDALSDYLDIVGPHGFGADNPFFGSSNLELQPTDLQRLVDELQDAITSVEQWTDFQVELEKKIIPEPLLTIASANNCRSVFENLQQAPEASQHFIAIVHANKDSVRFEDALSCAHAWVEHKTGMSDSVTDSVWTNDVLHLRIPLVKGVASLLSRVFGKYRSASKELSSYLKTELPKSPEDRLKLLDEIIEGRSKKDLFEEETEFLKAKLGEEWRGERTPFDEILSVLQWFQSTSKEIAEFTFEKLKGLMGQESTMSFSAKDFESRKGDLIYALQKVNARLGLSDLDANHVENLSLLDLKQRMNSMVENTDAYGLWTRTQYAKKKLQDLQSGELLVMIEEGKVEQDAAITELAYALAEARWNYSRSVKPELNKLPRLDRHALVDTFNSLEKRRVGEVQKAIKERHLSQVPKGSAGEMGIIRGEIAKKRNHRPIRQLMTGAAEMIQRIKPVFLMSPISVAQFLPPGKVEFDLLVIDEASQVKPEDALGSIARVKQIVVVGDQKQLPPTSFFDRLTDNATDEDENDDEIFGAKATEMESVLSLCEARGLNEGMLEWHYRSRDPSLIAVSNVEFYRNRLILPPCPTESDENFGMKWVRVPGVYSTATKGGGRPATNRIEAESIADRLKELATTRPDFSVGIVTFSKSQADMVTEVLELRRRQDDVLDRFLREDKIENVFVKNIENVQGDERDIILISVGYGPHEPNGKLPSMRFGPINSEGGERRLNVLFSRSRIACEVFTSFDPGDIDLNRASKEGPVVLKKFLEFAKTGELSETYVSEGDADSQFEEDVAEAIRSLGYEVDHQVGTAGFKIDLGVRNPSNSQHHILAVECDGATYHSALWARERDRMRQEVLEGFGWHFHRIWSTDWFYQRHNEIQRLRQALETATTRDLTRSLKGSNEEAPDFPELTEGTEVTSPVVLEDSFIEVPVYRKANIVVGVNHEPHERPVHEVVAILCEIIEVEGPVHTEEVARRYATAHGKSRLGSRISDHVKVALSRAAQDRKIEQRGKFWGTQEQFLSVPVRDRSNESVPTTSAENISSMEIIACAHLIEQESGKVDSEELVRVIAKTLGFKRAGPEFQSHVRECLKNRVIE
jgi:hypothetical protein